MFTHARADPDFSRAVLESLYSYPRKRRSVAWLLWLTLGWAGAHRFYLNREFSGLAMLLTGGGAFIWWALDGFFVDGFVRSYNADQESRKEEGRPPRQLDAMPRLDEITPEREPEWVERWRARGRTRKLMRLSGDALVLVVAGAALGGMIGRTEGALEAGVAVLLLLGLTAFAPGSEWIAEVPGLRGLPRWSHQLRLFYRHNPPGSPLRLIFRPLTAFVTAPFFARARAEARLYVELGAAFTAFFLLLDLIPGIVVPAVLSSRELDVGAFMNDWVDEVFMTFFLVYGFATPVGAIVNRHLLIERTHAIPRALCALTALMLALGALG